MLAGAVPSVA